MADYNSSYTGPQIDAAIGAVQAKESVWDSKQNALSAGTDYATPAQVNAVQSGLSSHTQNTGNPHGVTAAQVGALPLTGGTLTGDLTGQYITGSWLQGTASNHLSTAASKICVQDASGWVYHRTPAEVLSDIGGAPSYTYSTTDLTAGTSSLTTGKLYFVYE